MKILDQFSNLNERFLIAECVDILTKNEGMSILMPTETIYGLVCKWDDEEAKLKIQKLKKRFKSTTFQMYVAEIEMVVQAGFKLSKLARKIASRLCPAPLTIVDKNEDFGTIAFKIPDHTLMSNLVDEFDAPIAITSAGNSLTMQEGLDSLLGEPDIAVDMGPLDRNATPSTVVQISDPNFKILRPGGVSEASIKEAAS